MKNLLAISAGFVLVFFLLRALEAQTPEQQRRIEEEKRKALEKTELEILKGEGRIPFDYGGWINYRFDDYKDDDNDSSTRDTLDYTSSQDIRIWLRATLKPPADATYENEHSLYIRLKDLIIARRPEDVNKDFDHDGPHLDYAFCVLDLRPFWFEIGRRYFSVGQGISYSNVNDGIELLASLKDWNIKALISHSLPHEDNIDTSVPGYTKKSDRIFYGLEATYLGIANHGIYGYSLAQKDNSDEEPEDPLHDYTYNSQYIGLGSQGKITPTIHYWVEVIKEMGKSRIYTTAEKKDIDAWALDLGLSYDLNIYSHPNFSFEYAFGSGDSDRVSVTDTQNGNTSGKDKNFLYFGYLPTGNALSPRLSNIYFYKIATLFKPLEKIRNFRDLSLGIDYYRYYKHKSAGGIYDADATVNSDDVGYEIDVTCSWQILSDLGISIEFGHFQPGKAYSASSNDPEEYFSSSLTLTF